MTPARDRKDLKTARWARQRERILARDGHACTACGATEDLTVDHIIAVGAGGDAEVPDSELVALCNACNGRKSDRPKVRLDYRAENWF
ncbi:HNH endonuclease [Demequina litorisediminis]|uniref:HNH nuclease domain-containing protein n=1 Tax=Demequina litorisediminis TaxID=1849022 RepID=A0ABQ6ICK1_9MICO|nr:HNH endonuclease [Demequina litorisediminis]GMA34732.1 hypothetical protein GCM10025876_09360 [Demequina litorisediminis]